MTSSKPSRVAKKIYSVVLMLISLLPFLIFLIIPFGVRSPFDDSNIGWQLVFDFNQYAELYVRMFRLNIFGSPFTLNLSSIFGSPSSNFVYDLDIAICWFIFFQFIDIVLDFILLLPRFIHSLFERWSN